MADSCQLLYWNRFKKATTGELVAEMRCYARMNSLITTKPSSIRRKDNTSNTTFNCRNQGKVYFHYYGATEVKTGGWFSTSTPMKGHLRSAAMESGIVFYQIFPERFWNGDPANDPENTEPWGSTPTRENYLGGDLQGIIDKLDYLEDLGVRSPLTPIFKHHRTTNMIRWLLSDRPFLWYQCGSEKIGPTLPRERNKVILDGVFNHCGYFFPPFQDLLTNGVHSRYKDWFLYDRLPLDPENLNYETTGYYRWMPKLRLSNPEVRAYIFEIARFWMTEAQIDGWRLDVADEADYTFWQEFRRVVKAINPQCFILAETWRENREMLRGDQMDSVMNYLFRDAVVDFFAKKQITPHQFDARINRFLGVYPTTAHLSLYNLLGSHDTPRFLTLCQEDHRVLKAASAFQLCFPGIAGIYYGDEIGLTGENDPDCRKCMDWAPSSAKRELYAWHQRLIALRKKLKPLRFGRFASNYCATEDFVYGFYREWEGDRVYVVINNSDRVTAITYPVLEAPANHRFLTDQLSGERHLLEPAGNNRYHNDDLHSYQGALCLTLQPYQVKIITVN